MRYIIRSACIGPTARRLKSALQARSVIRIERVIQADYQQDLFLAYPPLNKVANAPVGYSHTQAFYNTDKGTQRLTLQGHGLPTIPSRLTKFEGRGGDAPLRGERFVVRPLRHRQGQGFRITTDAQDFIPGREYIAEFVNKQKEFRILYYKGKLVCTYLKANPTNVPSDQPWTHLNGFRFCTIERQQNNPLPQSLYDQLSETLLIKTAHLLGIDVLWDGRQAYICEVNMSPGITIQTTIDKIVQLSSL